MVKPKQLLLLLSMVLSLLGFGQGSVRDHDFTKIDSLARAIKYDNDIYKLTKQLTTPYTEQLLQVRSIFIWITENIRYDYKYINKGKELKGPKCKQGMDCEQVFRDWEKAYLKRVLKKKKGVCDGYARLFKKMCDLSGIRSEIIAGYTKTKPYQIGMTGPVNHAWNAVWLDSAYFLLDATWAAGGCEEDEETGKLKNFRKSYDDYYWFTPFNDLARNHYPRDGKWVLETNYTKEKFAANPYYHPGHIRNIKLIAPASGILAAKKGDTICFKIDYTGSLNELQINSNFFRNPDIWVWEEVSKRKRVLKLDTLAVKKQQYITYRQDGTVYEFKYVVPDNSLYYLDILFDRQRVMRFKVVPNK